MKTFVNLLKLLALATIITSCAYEPDQGLLPKAKTDSIDVLDKKPAGEVLKTKYTTLSAVCKLQVQAAPPASGTGVTGGADSGNGTGDINAETDGSTANPEGNGPPPAAPQAEQADAPVVTPPSNAASDTVTVNFMAQLAKDPKLANKITDAVMILDISSSSSGTTSATTTVPTTKRVTVNLTVEPLTFKDNETLAVDSVVYVMKHSPRMSATAAITTDSSGTAGASDTQTVSVIEGIQSKVDSAKAGVSIVCDLKGTPDDKNELVKGQWIKVDCKKNEADFTDNAEKAIFKLNCKGGKPNLPKEAPPAVQGEGSPFPNP